MRGVPANLDLSFLHGAEVVQLCLGRHQLQVHFHPSACINVEGRWELEDDAGRLIDGGSPGADGEACRLIRILGRQVVGFAVAAPVSFALIFDDGLVWRVYDSSPEFESFSIQPSDIYV
jgi:hypothetical protein